MPEPQQLWAPWRMQFILGNKDDACVFCLENIPPEMDEEKLILYRGKTNFVIMNLYPYNCSHLLVVPYRHISNIEDLTEEELLEMSLLTRKSIAVIKEKNNPEGFNIGMNLGKCAGAGIADHIHQHIVPRWTGDTNFLPLLSGTRCMPQYLSETYKILKSGFKEYIS
ncbi:MAG: HIT domain-containing protein [Nitrospinae bacterium]|nr:HIT domain-containing protein [Nitrospinota bacterium]